MPGLRRGLGVLGTALAALAVASCGRKVSDAECRKLLDHYTELLVREEEPTSTPEQVARALEEARRTAEEDPRFEMAACPSRVARKSYDCAMNAASVDAVERCLVF